MNSSSPQFLDPLVQDIVQEVTNAVSTKLVLPGERFWLEWKASTFSYSENGPEFGVLTGNRVARPDWSAAPRILQPRIANHATYLSILDALKNDYPDQAAAMPDYLGKFTLAAISIVVSDTANIRVPELESLCKNFLNDLAAGPITHSAKVNVNGIVLRPPSIQIAVGVRLRQTTREDIENASPSHFEFHNPLANTPQAIAEIQYVGARDQTAELQREVGRFISVLRLFGVGSVFYTSYQMESNAVLSAWGAHATLGSGIIATAGERYVIKQEDEDRLKMFWRTMSHAIPKGCYDFQKQVSHLTLAYDRYSDAILNNGIVERRIANAVMGLEALLLDEPHELNYRLGIRIAKALSLVGKRPLEVRHRIHDAYRIRSLFAHGGHLSYKEKARLERRYGDMKNFMLPLFDYLRSLIVLMIALHSDKGEVIDLLDDALIDQEKHETLKSRVSPLTSLVSSS